jgi:hypothetical protein
MDAYFVDAERDRPDEAGPLRMRYVAMAETPEEAIEAVRTLVSAETVLHATGSTLSLHIARAIGVRPGQAKLV